MTTPCHRRIMSKVGNTLCLYIIIKLKHRHFNEIKLRIHFLKINSFDLLINSIFSFNFLKIILLFCFTDLLLNLIFYFSLFTRKKSNLDSNNPKD